MAPSYSLGTLSADVQVNDRDFIGRINKIDAAFAGLAAGIVVGMKKAVSSFASLEETTNLFNVVFKNNKVEMEKWVKTIRNNLGMGSEEIMKFAGNFKSVTEALGLSERAAVDLSKELTNLTFDISSFRNQDPESVFLALQNAMTGEMEMLKRFGVVIRVADVEQRAFNLGLAKTKDELTEQMKVEARMSLIREAFINDTGDMVRTSDSLTNQMKRLRANSKELFASWGESINKVLSPLIQSLNKLLEVIIKIADENPRLADTFAVASTGLVGYGAFRGVSGVAGTAIGSGIGSAAGSLIGTSSIRNRLAGSAIANQIGGATGSAITSNLPQLTMFQRAITPIISIIDNLKVNLRTFSIIFSSSVGIFAKLTAGFKFLLIPLMNIATAIGLFFAAIQVIRGAFRGFNALLTGAIIIFRDWISQFSIFKSTINFISDVFDFLKKYPSLLIDAFSKLDDWVEGFILRFETEEMKYNRLQREADIYNEGIAKEIEEYYKQRLDAEKGLVEALTGIKDDLLKQFLPEKGLMNDFLDTLKNFKDVGKNIEDQKSKLKTDGTGDFGDLFTGLRLQFESDELLLAFGSFFDKTIEDIKGMTDMEKERFKKYVDIAFMNEDINESTFNAFNMALQNIEETVEETSTWYEEFVEGLGNIIKKKFEQISDQFNNNLNQITELSNMIWEADWERYKRQTTLNKAETKRPVDFIEKQMVGNLANQMFGKIQRPQSLSPEEARQQGILEAEQKLVMLMEQNNELQSQMNNIIYNSPGLVLQGG